MATTPLPLGLEARNIIRSHASQSSELVPSASFSWIPVTGYSRRQALQDFDQHRPCQHAHERRGWHKHRESHEWRSRWICLTKHESIPRVTFSVSIICLRSQTANCGDISIHKSTPNDANKRDPGGIDGPMIDGSRMKSRDKMIAILGSAIAITSDCYYPSNAFSCRNQTALSRKVVE